MEEESRKAVLLSLGSPIAKQRIRRAVEILLESNFSIDYVLSSSVIADLRDHAQELDGKVTALPESRSLKTVGGMIRELKAVRIYTNPFNRSRSHLRSISYWIPGYSSVLANIGKDYDLILAEDIQLLPHALELSRLQVPRPRTVCELRDYYWRIQAPSNTRRSLPKKIFTSLLRIHKNKIMRVAYRSCLSEFDVVFTVSRSLADSIWKTTGVSPEVVMSLPKYTAAPSSLDKIESSINYVYHGLADRNRNFERIIRVFQEVKRNVKITFYLVAGDQSYIKDLKMCQSERVVFKEPVNYKDLIGEAAKYDVGLVFYPDTSTSMEGALPNKFFEYFQSRLPVLASPSEDMASILHEYQVGWVTDDWSFDSLVRLLESITPEMVAEAKKNCERAAKTFCFEANRAELERVLLGDERTGPDHSLSPAGREAIE